MSPTRATVHVDWRNFRPGYLLTYKSGALEPHAMWTILPIQDYISVDGALRNEDTQGERINVPSNPQHYWRYRLHINLEELIGEKDFNATLKGMIHQSERNSLQS